ncbi:hypothetical protein GPECTOR_5g294 [Gonium pectorale]|uniref:Uncharacterized protein n=1 Tax=Gonium pectorale TaxID=33097 RepID=A0A150GXX8_GONPE|nr:hypothetical protein GPECTOR_5g294 [Gonium pectorale]|eukprot:KXZ54200.1 hypothetical protein GPECTOR_5g294 [Gonium pectorale]
MSDLDEEESAKRRRIPAVWQLLKDNVLAHRKRKMQDEDDIMICHCKPVYRGGDGCGPDCINRMLCIECVPGFCPSEDKCTNQMFSKRMYANLEIRRAGAKGFGLYALEDIKAGQFIIEYIGEVLEEDEYQRRKDYYMSVGQRHYYFMNIGNGEVIDACRKGNISRFINHSCEPNCETQKWLVRGELAIGLFAVRDIPKDTELTFDYNFERYGDKPMRCYCQSQNCRQFIGGMQDNVDVSLLAPVEPDNASRDLPPIMLTDADMDPNMRMLLEWRVGTKVDKAKEMGMITRLERICKSRNVNWSVKHFYGQEAPPPPQDDAAIVPSTSERGTDQPQAVVESCAGAGPAPAKSKQQRKAEKAGAVAAAAAPSAAKGKATGAKQQLDGATHAAGVAKLRIEEGATPVAASGPESTPREAGGAQAGRQAGTSAPSTTPDMAQVRGPKALFKQWKIMQQQEPAPAPVVEEKAHATTSSLPSPPSPHSPLSPQVPQSPRTSGSLDNDDAALEEAAASARRSASPPPTANGRGARKLRSEIDRRLDEVVGSNGRLKDPSRQNIIKVLRLFNLCDIGGQSGKTAGFGAAAGGRYLNGGMSRGMDDGGMAGPGPGSTGGLTARQRARMADLSLLLDVVLKTSSSVAKKEFVTCGLLTQLHQAMGRNTGKEYCVILRKVLRVVEMLPLEANDVYAVRSAHGNFADMLRQLSSNADYDVRTKASALLKKFPPSAVTDQRLLQLMAAPPVRFGHGRGGGGMGGGGGMRMGGGFPGMLPLAMQQQLLQQQQQMLQQQLLKQQQQMMRLKDGAGSAAGSNGLPPPPPLGPGGATTPGDGAASELPSTSLMRTSSSVSLGDDPMDADLAGANGPAGLPPLGPGRQRALAVAAAAAAALASRPGLLRPMAARGGMMGGPGMLGPMLNGLGAMNAAGGTRMGLMGLMGMGPSPLGLPPRPPSPANADAYSGYNGNGFADDSMLSSKRRKHSHPHGLDGSLHGDSASGPLPGPPSRPPYTLASGYRQWLRPVSVHYADVWEEPDASFEAFVTDMVRHRLGKYLQPEHPSRVTVQEATMLRAKVYREVVAKERRAWEERRSAGVYKPIERHKLEANLKEFVRSTIKRMREREKEKAGVAPGAAGQSHFPGSGRSIT